MDRRPRTARRTATQGSAVKKTLVTLLLITVASAVNAADVVPTTKKYPPYPEVWGYELPIHNSDRYYRRRFVRMSDGDIYITHGKKGISPPEFVGFGFFKGEPHTYSVDQYNRFWAENRPRELGVGLPVLSKITFSDGSSVRLGGSGGGGSCYSPFGHYLEAMDKDGKTIARKSLVYLLKAPHTVPYSSRCVDAQGEVTEHAQSEDIALITLEDDTFVAYEQRGNVILRVDKRLNTRFPVNKRVFLVDWDVIERLREEAQRDAQGDVQRGDQKLNDAIYQHLMKLRGGKP